MFGKILVAIDGSGTSEKALECALDEAKVWKSALHVIYVVETGLFSSLPMDNTWEIMLSLLEKEGNTALGDAQNKADKKGIAITTHLKEGHAGNEIIKIADDMEADLVVIGSHGKSNVDRILLGSISSYVVSNCRTAVLVVRA
ncbi:MAG TPA: universal stress protein [Methanoregulaceae archaeon]|nr:universal stress protein [Methanoregulaceae archaeon]